MSHSYLPRSISLGLNKPAHRTPWCYSPGKTRSLGVQQTLLLLGEGLATCRRATEGSACVQDVKPIKIERGGKKTSAQGTHKCRQTTRRTATVHNIRSIEQPPGVHKLLHLCCQHPASPVVNGFGVSCNRLLHVANLTASVTVPTRKLQGCFVSI